MRAANQHHVPLSSVYDDVLLLNDLFVTHKVKFPLRAARRPQDGPWDGNLYGLTYPVLPPRAPALPHIRVRGCPLAGPPYGGLGRRLQRL